MKQDKILTIVLAIANMILIVFCAIFYLQIDRAEPKFEFQAVNTVYRSGMDEAKLLEGITAYDSEDGDVTDRIVIEKKIEDAKESSLVVYYAVSDKAGNVAKCSRVFPAVLLSKETSPHAEAELLMEAGVTADLEKSSEGTMQSDVLIEPTSVPDVTPDPSLEEEESERPSETPTPTPSPTPENPPAPPAPTVNPAAPVLTLKTNQVVAQKGKNPAWVNYIATMTDDKDSYETLFYNLKVSKYNINEPGAYQATVYTEDSDGNKSGQVAVTITVQ